MGVGEIVASGLAVGAVALTIGYRIGHHDGREAIKVEIAREEARKALRAPGPLAPASRPLIVAGQVLDAETGLPVGGASVIITDWFRRDPSDFYSPERDTDAGGRFAFDDLRPPEDPRSATVSLVVRQYGYEPAVLSARFEDSAVVRLRKDQAPAMVPRPDRRPAPSPGVLWSAILPDGREAYLREDGKLVGLSEVVRSSQRFLALDNRWSRRTASTSTPPTPGAP